MLPFGVAKVVLVKLLAELLVKIQLSELEIVVLKNPVLFELIISIP